MIQTTYREIWSHKVEITSSHVLYIIRDVKTIFYVGMSTGEKGIRERVLHHSGEPIQSLLNHNRPASLEWQVELLTLDDCSKLLGGGYFYTYSGQSKYEVRQAESDLILRCRPCVNCLDNPNPTPLPAQYCPLPWHPFWRKVPKLYFDRVMTNILYTIIPEAGQATTGYLTAEEMRTITSYITEMNKRYNPQGRYHR